MSQADDKLEEMLADMMQAKERHVWRNQNDPDLQSIMHIYREPCVDIDRPICLFTFHGGVEDMIMLLGIAIHGVSADFVMVMREIYYSEEEINPDTGAAWVEGEQDAFIKAHPMNDTIQDAMVIYYFSADEYKVLTKPFWIDPAKPREVIWLDTVGPNAEDNAVDIIGKFLIEHPFTDERLIDVIDENDPDAPPDGVTPEEKRHYLDTAMWKTLSDSEHVIDGGMDMMNDPVRRRIFVKAGQLGTGFVSKGTYHGGPYHDGE